MKKGILMFTGCAMLLSAAPAAFAYSDSGHYLSLNAGMAMLDDTELGNPTVLAIESDPGIALSAALGYEMCSFFRIEAELAHQKNDMDKVTLVGYGVSADIDGDTNSLSGLVNGYIDFVNHTSATPFLSAGIGAAKVEASIGGDSWDDTALAYQLGGGVNFAINPFLSIDVKYRYFAVPDVTLDDTDFDYSSHNIYGGLRFNF